MASGELLTPLLGLWRPHLEGDQTIERLHERVKGRRCFTSLMSFIGVHHFAAEPLFLFGSGLERNDDRTHSSSHYAGVWL